MKTFRDLEIHPDGEPGAYISKLEQNLPEGWTRNFDSEQRTGTIGACQYYCFTCENRQGLEVATLFFIEREDGALYVCNIVPRDKSSLSYGEYNMILDDFADSVIAKLPGADEHLVLASSDTVDFKVILGEEAYKLLDRFAMTSNRSSGSAHPSDREKWFDFIHYVHDNDIDFGPSQFKRYILEEAKWPEKTGWDLVLEYEFALDLLAYPINS